MVRTIHRGTVSLLVFACAGMVFAQATLENPGPGSFQSGIGLISGWSCTSGVSVKVDGTSYAVAYGTPRADASSACGGNANVGFGLLFNYNLFGAGGHSAQLMLNGAAMGSAVPFTVTTLGGEFLTGLAKQVVVADFPQAGRATSLTWQQSQQNFAIAANNPAKGMSVMTLAGVDTLATVATLENPAAGSFQSGIGLISGWSCTSGVSVMVDGTSYAVAYGTPRADAASACGGNANVGYGLLFNYNLFGAGNHSAQLMLNGAAIGAPVPFTVTTLGGEFLTGLAKQVVVTDFPQAGKTTTLAWQQAQQNFAVAAESAQGVATFTRDYFVPPPDNDPTSPFGRTTTAFDSGSGQYTVTFYDNAGYITNTETFFVDNEGVKTAKESTWVRSVDWSIFTDSGDPVAIRSDHEWDVPSLGFPFGMQAGDVRVFNAPERVIHRSASPQTANASSCGGVNWNVPSNGKAGSANPFIWEFVQQKHTWTAVGLEDVTLPNGQVVNAFKMRDLIEETNNPFNGATGVCGEPGNHSARTTTYWLAVGKGVVKIQ
jgi:hypothetical protein